MTNKHDIEFFLGGRCLRNTSTQPASPSDFIFFPVINQPTGERRLQKSRNPLDLGSTLIVPWYSKPCATVRQF
jgi:hypothetical protein